MVLLNIGKSNVWIDEILEQEQELKIPQHPHLIDAAMFIDFVTLI